MRFTILFLVLVMGVSARLKSELLHVQFNIKRHVEVNRVIRVYILAGSTNAGSAHCVVVYLTPCFTTMCV